MGEIDRLAEQGNITSDNHRKTISCNDCRTTWYGRTDPFNETGATVATEFCPYCGGDSISISVNGSFSGPASAMLEMSVDEAERLSNTIDVAVANARGNRDD